MRRPRTTAVAAAGTLAGAAMLAATAVTTLVPASAAPTAQVARYLVVATSPTSYGPLRTKAQQLGARVHDLNGTSTLAIDATPETASALKASPLAASVARDHVETVIAPESGPVSKPTQRPQHHDLPGGSPAGGAQDPAASLPGLMWNQARIRSPQADAVNGGSKAVTVAVADTGLDYTHPELTSQVSHVQDFSSTLCKDWFGASDADLSAAYGGPADTDWNGHGTWIGGNIAAALDGQGVNGVAPKINLVALKISQWCGAAYDSEILAAFEYAARTHVDVVSISFGGYLDRSVPDQDAIFQSYVKTVADAARAGTMIVAAAGNEHVRIGAGGRVLSHGSLTVPGDAIDDLYGLYETPGGIPGVVDVSATGNVVAAPTACTPVAENGQYACKPISEAHQAAGVGRADQLAYYSNYGPRIDLAAPGGARKFNLPNADRGGSPGFPYTAQDGSTAFEDFSITSDWSTEISCWTSASPAFHPGHCYSTIQGTSMATPHVSAVAALAVSAHPSLRHRPSLLLTLLKTSARKGTVNFTQGLSATDTSAGDQTGIACPSGYCHLGGPAVPSPEAYGSGIVDAFRAVS